MKQGDKRITVRWSDADAVYRYYLETYRVYSWLDSILCAGTRTGWHSGYEKNTDDRAKAERWAKHYGIECPEEPEV